MADSYNILSETVQEFSQQTREEILKDIAHFKSEINSAILKIKNLNRRRLRDSKATVLKEGYQIVMEIREKFLGQSIGYRLYLSTQDGKETKIVNMTTQEILNLVQYERGGLRLKRLSDKSIREIKSSLGNQNLYSKYMEQHFSYIMKQFEQVKSKKTGQTSYIVANKNYAQSHMTAKGGLRQYNKGWIFQALDQTFYDLYDTQLNNSAVSIPNNQFAYHYFTKALNYDNLVGFKGGDVGETQIKANAAALMSAKTINKYLQELSIIFNSFNKFNSKELSLKLQELFTDTLNPDERINSIIDKNVEAILDNMVF